MTDDLLARALRRAAQQVPFQPYVIEFFSGERVTVRHPEAATFRNGVGLFRTPGRETHVFEAASVCRVLIPAVPAPPGA